MKATRALRPVARLLLALQALLVLTGGAVRVTGSGLGCPTWPECTTDSYFPVEGQEEKALHAWIEFGNRLLTFVLLINALALMFTILKSGKRELRRLGALQILGILAQGVLGGITVLTALNPATVAAHFLLSIILIAGALSLRQRAHGKSPIEITLIPLVTKLIWLHLFLTSLVLIAGTIVTGSGPHAGDSAAERFNLDSRTMAWIHADLVIALLGVSIALVIAIRLGLTGQARQVLSGRIQIFLIVALAQGSIGYIQYFTKLPEALVAAHIIGSIAVWLSAWNLFISSNLGANLIARKGL